MYAGRKFEMKARCQRFRSQVIIASLFATSGCTVIPGTESSVSDTRNTSPLTFAGSLSAPLAAKCIMKNIDERYGSMTSSLQEGTRSHALELRVRSAVGVAAIIEIEPAEGGSLMTAWISSHYLAKRTLLNTFTNGC